MRHAFAKKAPATRHKKRAVPEAGPREAPARMPPTIREHEEDRRLDQALKETFPASDPISPYIPAGPDKKSSEA